MEEPWSTMALLEMWASSEHLFPEARAVRHSVLSCKMTKGAGVGIHLFIKADNCRQVPLWNDGSYGRAKVKEACSKAGKVRMGEIN